MTALIDEARGLHEIAEALVIVGPAAIEPLMVALRDGSEEVVTSSSVPLGALGAVEAVPLMLNRLTETNNSMKGEVREAIRRIGPRAMPALVEGPQALPPPVSSPRRCSDRFRVSRLRGRKTCPIGRERSSRSGRMRTQARNSNGD